VPKWTFSLRAGASLGVMRPATLAMTNQGEIFNPEQPENAK
jgi:hypothetical protein